MNYVKSKSGMSCWAKAALALTFAQVLLFASCSKTVLKQLDFFEVATEKPADDTVGVLVLQGALTNLGDETQIEECGFLVSGDPLSVENGTAPALQTLRPEAGNRSFSYRYVLHAGDPRIYFRAYARIGARMKLAPFSVEHTYKIGSIVADALFISRENDVAYVRCSTTDLNETNSKRASRHGFVFSSDVEMPEIDLPDCDTVELMEIYGNQSFSASLPALSLNSTYHLRAFAIVDGVVFYSPASTVFEIGDGWKYAGRLPEDIYGFSDGGFTVAGATNRAYGGFACPNPGGGCSGAELGNDLFEISPGAGVDTVALAKKKEFPDLPRTNASIFSIGDAIYVFFGEQGAGDDRQPVNGLWKYLTQSDAWVSVPPPPISTSLNPRSGTAVFVLNGKAYFGGGEIKEKTTPGVYEWKETNEVWEYDPSNNQWKQMADLPMKRNPFDVQDTLTGRRELVGFSIEGYGGYFGGGLVDGLMLKDFWHFNAPDNANPAGSWTYAGHLPPEAKGRTETVAFALGNHAYLGTGRHLTDGDLRDFWAFDPASNQWSAREPLPSMARALAFGFSLDNFGYIGGGTSHITSTLRNNVDIWRYEPEK